MHWWNEIGAFLTDSCLQIEMVRILGAPSRAYALASRLYPPLLPRELMANVTINSASHRTMLELGLIDHSGHPGLYHLLPMATRALEKLTRIICQEMDSIGGQRIQMPSLVGKSSLEKTDRWTVFGNDLFRLQDRNGDEFCLAPTHEEAVTQLVANRLHEMSATNSTPLILYQITSKFRDEMRSKYGLLRCREFLMKDAYSFDVDETEAKKTYHLFSQAYQRIFTERLSPLKRPLMRVSSDVGAMGGSASHEFHLENDCGQDRIDFCGTCQTGVNRELIKTGQPGDSPSKCSTCDKEMKTFRTVEMAHTFLLGTKYSQAFEAYFRMDSGHRMAYMGCYGIGVTRLLAILIDSNLAKNGQLRWPLAITPYKICLIPPKFGSKEEKMGATQFAQDVLQSLNSIDHLNGEIILDDRTDLTVGRRLVDAKRLGYPFILVANKSIVQGSIPKFELYDLTKEDGDVKMELVTHEQLFDRMREIGLG